MMWRSTTLTIVSVTIQCGVAAQPVLMPGANIADCRSALQIGVETCGRGTDSETDSVPPSITEDQVNEYLAHYGKPPREAIRALLDPSDKNIAAWIRHQRQVVSTASYVAARMTQMQLQLEAIDDPAEILACPPPAMIHMRATLFLSSDSASSRQAVHALGQVVSRYPSIDARLMGLGPLSETHLPPWLENLGTLLAVSAPSAPSEAGDDYAAPSLLIEDLRYRTSRRLDADELTARRICDEIVALRSGAELDGGGIVSIGSQQ